VAVAPEPKLGLHPAAEARAAAVLGARPVVAVRANVLLLPLPPVKRGRRAARSPRVRHTV
jgi:hypothetical protein